MKTPRLSGRREKPDTFTGLAGVVVGGVQKEAKVDKIGLAEFLMLFSRDAKGIEYGTEEAIDWKNDEWLKIERDGVYMDLPPVEDLERVAIDVRIYLERHPKQDHSLPVLSFPCTAKEFEDFIEWFELHEYYDIELLEKFSATIKQAPPRTRNQDNILLIKRALNGLRQVLDREPSSDEVWDALEQYDEEEVIGSDSNNDVLYWNPRSGGVKQMTRKTFNNQVALLKKKFPPHKKPEV